MKIMFPNTQPNSPTDLLPVFFSNSSDGSQLFDVIREGMGDLLGEYDIQIEVNNKQMTVPVNVAPAGDLKALWSLLKVSGGQEPKRCIYCKQDVGIFMKGYPTNCGEYIT